MLVEKAAMRRAMKELLRGITEEERALAEVAWEKRAMDLRCRCIAAFVPLPGEPPIARFLAALCQRSVELLLPRVDVNRLTFHAVGDLATLRPGWGGIGEPDPKLHPEVPLANAELILVPGVAFDRCGGRLGRGKGFYDRALAGVLNSLLIGAAWERQVLPEGEWVPAESHDVAVAELWTEVGEMGCGKNRQGVSFRA
jgi:5-formyltetrahydrofolate cyclo-ligase